MIKKTECPIETLRKKGADLIDRVRFGQERIVVTSYGKLAVAIVSIDDLARLENCVKFDPAEAVAIKSENIGSEFDEFLREEGIFDKVSKAARKRVAQWLHAQRTRRPIAIYEARARKAGVKTLVEPVEIPAVAKITKRNRHREVRTGKPVGREAW